MQSDEDTRAAVEEAQRAAGVRREAVLALSKAERLRLVAELCLQAAVLPSGERGA